MKRKREMEEDRPAPKSSVGIYDPRQMDLLLVFLPRVLSEMALSYLSNQILHAHLDYDHHISQKRLFCFECERNCRLHPLSEREVILDHFSYADERGCDRVRFSKLDTSRPGMTFRGSYKDSDETNHWLHVDELGVIRSWRLNQEIGTMVNPMVRDPKMYGLLRVWSVDARFKSTLLDGDSGVYIQRVKTSKTGQKKLKMMSRLSIPGTAFSVWRMAIDGNQETIVLCLLFRDGRVRWCFVPQGGGERESKWCTFQLPVPPYDPEDVVSSSSDETAVLGVSMTLRRIVVWKRDACHQGSTCHLWIIPFSFHHDDVISVELTLL